MVEQAALAWFSELGYAALSGPTTAPGEPAAGRDDYSQVVLPRRLRDALAQLYPAIPADALDETYRKLTRPEFPSVAQNNRAFHRFLADGLPVEYLGEQGRVLHQNAQLVNFDEPEANDWLVVDQFTVVEGQHNRRPDLVVFVNGLPLAVIELKNPADEQATIWTAFNQLQTYKEELPSFFAYNDLMIISDGLQARLGSLTADREWFLPWRTTCARPTGGGSRST